MATIVTAGETRKIAPNYDFEPPQKGGERARVLVQGTKFGADLADLFPHGTTTISHHLDRLTQVYVVTTRGYTIQQFIEIVKLYEDGKFDEVDRLVAELFPRRTRD